MKKALYVGLCLLLGLYLFPIAATAAASTAIASGASSSLLANPTGLLAVPGNNHVDLSWQAVPGADSYNVKRSTVNGGPYDTIVGNTTAAVFTDSSAVNGMIYFYVITAVSTSMESMISNQAKAVPYAPIPGAPAAPIGFVATAGDGSVSLTWDPVPGAASYSVKRRATNGGLFTTVANGLTSPLYTDNSVVNGTTYEYVVTAVNANGASPDSKAWMVAPAKVIVVDPNGSGSFTTVQQAVDSIPADNSARTVIYIKEGIYREKVTVNAPLVSFVGAGRDKTEIVYDLSNAKLPNQPLKGASVTINGNQFTAQNLTLANDAPPSEGQALALAVNADQAVFENVKLVGYQDTLYAGVTAVSPKIGRQYYRNSVIIGRVDYIYGPASAAVFDHVDAVSINTPDTGSGGYVTAAAQKQSTDPGFVFLNSRLLKDSSATGLHYLGRPWQDFPTVRYINTWMDDHIAPAGWTTMQVNPAYFGEYNSSGPGASPNTRVMSTSMTADEASNFTIPRIFNGWDPTERVIIPLAPPQITAAVAPALPDGENGFYTKPAVVSIGISNNEYGAFHAEYRINGGAWTPYTAEFEVGAQGINTVEYRLIDDAAYAGTIQTATVKVDPNAPRRVAAFPGAEGGAMYATGGRGQAVYEVTTLEDYSPSGFEPPIPGSFRDAISQDNRTIVFRVSGNIQLKERLSISHNNLTIAGQTAPGDGIALSGWWVNIGGDNNIIRYIRFRDGINALGDAADVSGNNIIVDHCSFSWSSDETLSLKEHKNITVQWNIISDSLNQSIHGKGAHGYGGIWGGTNVTYHHNLIANHASRNPRFDRQAKPDLYPTKIDYRNNIIYNWGFNSAYGGEQATGINMINNYYKPGPSTFDGVKTRIVNPSSQQAGTWYIDGNVIEGYPALSADNWAKSVQPDYGLDTLTRLNHPVVLPDASDPIGGPVTTDTAADAYAKVLQSVGAVLPKRDSLDARIIDDVKAGAGRIINTIESDGGLPVLKAEAPPADNDHDGMPDDWEIAHGLNPADPSDRNGDNSGDGTTNLEKYMNAIVRSGSINPQVTISSPVMHQVFAENNDIAITADASDSDGTIAKVEFYDGSVKLGEAASAPYTFTWQNAPEGEHYIYAKAIDDTGTMTLPSVAIMYVNGPDNVAPWNSQDIGQVKLPGTASLNGNVYKVKGSGKIGSGNQDSLHYVYQQVQGNFEMIAKIDFASEIDNSAKAGLMIRASLQPDAPATMLALSTEELFGRQAQFLNRDTQHGAYTETDLNGDNFNPPYWFKIVRDGDTISGYASQDKQHWAPVGSATASMPDQVYVGMAIDAAKSTSNSDYLAAATFTDVSLNRSPAFTVNNPQSETVSVPVYHIVGHMLDGAYVTITGNGGAIVDSKFIDANTDFDEQIPLAEGMNMIVISAQNSDVFGEMVNKKTITVTYNKSAPVITLAEQLPAVVTSSGYSLSATVNKNAAVSVTLNGSIVLDSAPESANVPFTVPLSLHEGNNTIVISAVDDYGIATTDTYLTAYRIDWGTGLFTVSGLSLSDLDGKELTGLRGSQDTYVQAYLHNNSAVEQNGVFVIALFDRQDRMVRYAFIEQTVSAGMDQQVKALLHLPADLTGFKVKAFVWNGMSTKRLVSNEVTAH